MLEISNLVCTSEFGGALRGELDGKPVYVPIEQKPYLLKAGCVTILFRIMDGWDFDGPLPEIEVEVEPGRVEKTNRAARSPELVKLCRALSRDGGYHLGEVVGKRIELST